MVLAGLHPLLPSYHPALPAAVLVADISFLPLAGAEVGRLAAGRLASETPGAAAAASSAACLCAPGVRGRTRAKDAGQVSRAPVDGLIKSK